jgi:hypothetical protein
VLPGSQLQTCAGEPMLRRAICSIYNIIPKVNFGRVSVMV